MVDLFYLLLVVGSFWVLFINPRLFGNMFPYSADETVIRFMIVHVIFVGTDIWFWRQESV